MPSRSRKSRVTHRATLNERQERFAELVARGRPAGRAAREAGYTSGNCYQQGHELLRNPKVAARVAELRENRLKGYVLTAARIDQERKRIATYDPRDLVDPETGQRFELHELDEDLARSIASVKVKVATVVRGPKKLPAVAGSLGVELEDQDGRKVEEITLGTVEYKFHNKTAALDSGDRVLGRFKDKLEVQTTLSHEQLLVLAQKIRERKRLAASRAGGAAGQGKPAAPAGGRAQ